MCVNFDWLKLNKTITHFLLIPHVVNNYSESGDEPLPALTWQEDVGVLTHIIMNFIIDLINPKTT